MTSYRTITLNPGREKVLARKHPWIFSRALRKPSPEIKEGDIVTVQDSHGNFQAIASYHKNNIALRILAFEEISIDAHFFTSVIEDARKVRRTAGLPAPHTNCYRLIHGEGDGVSGLIIDIYGNTAVVQCHNLAIYQLRQEITQGLLNVMKEDIKFIYNKSSKLLPKSGIEDDYLYKSDHLHPSEIVVENNISFKIDWKKGQKTGFFLDQRENRKLLQSYVTNKNVLNCFSYTGGFSMYALAAGAQFVKSVDVSESAIEMVKENALLNKVQKKSTAIVADVMKYLKDAEKNYYDIIIVDPPAFAKNVSKKHNAVQAYKRLNTKALSLIKSGGLLFTFSCSQVIDTPLFTNTIIAAAIESGRKARIIHTMKQGIDHPINIYHPESSYLKGLVLYVN